MAVLQNIEPSNVFGFFEEICGIPHGSGNVKKISDYLVKFATDRGLEYIQDESYNVVIYKPGTEGYEKSQPVIIQGHMDMVCEKDEDCDIDFENEGLRLQCEDDLIYAEGTTLGGDDGVALAYALAVLDSGFGDAPIIPHPPIEAVFTVDEEIGMLGAADLDMSVLKSRIMLNIDSEEEGKLLVSCAGGVSAECKLPVECCDVDGALVKLTVDGLAGGHSGVEIDKQGANANKVLGRLLYKIRKKMDIRIIDVAGGLKDNAIPRQATANIVVLKNGEMPKRVVIAEELNCALSEEYIHTDPDIKITTDEVSDDNICNNIRCMDEASTKKVIDALVCLPNGVQRMSMDIKGLVQTSLNLGILNTNKKDGDATSVDFRFSVRSSVGSEKEELVERLSCTMEALGGTIKCVGDYPGWEYRQESPLRDIMTSVYEELYGEKPEIQAIHAGLECGLFAGELPGLDCVSFGPQIDDIHTSQETLHIESTRRCWKYLLEVLKRLK